MLKCSSIVSITAGLACLMIFGCSKEEAPLAAPMLLHPADGTSFIADTTTLSWNDTTGAASYAVQVSTDHTFSTFTVNTSTSTQYFAITPPLVNNTTYYWRVSSTKAQLSATNAQRTSAWSSIFSFTTGVPAPTNLQPTGPLNPDTLTLNWYGSTRATMYYVQLSTDNAFSPQTLIINDSTTSSQFAITSPLSADSMTYYWRVCVSTSQGVSAWSLTQTFQTWFLPPPTLLTPANGGSGVSLTDSLLTWTPFPTTDWWASSYHVQVSTTTDFSSGIAIDTTETASSKTISTLSPGTLYYWRVASIDFLSRQSAWWSTVWSFTTQ
jgi:hypothetical protein